MASYDPRTDIPAVTRAGWQCPECRTVYSPDVAACHCAAGSSLAERAAGGPGYRPNRFVYPVCTCPPVWNSILPPPPCPVHGQSQRLQVMC
jgi:hypothetical protein